MKSRTRLLQVCFWLLQVFISRFFPSFRSYNMQQPFFIFCGLYDCGTFFSHLITQRVTYLAFSYIQHW